MNKTWWTILASQFKSSLMLVLLVAIAVTVVIGDLRDAVVIGVAVLINSGLGFLLEYKAEQSLNSLRKLISQRAILKVGGDWKEVDAGILNKGDVVRLTIGQRIPADGEIVEEDAIHINESILTGESLSVTKKVGDRCFMGTIVEGGIAVMRVLKVGKDTRIGEISGTMDRMVEGLSPMQRKINGLSKTLSVVVLLAVMIIFISGVWGGRSWTELLPLSVALAVAAVPEGLVVSLTVILSLGMKRILSKKAIVKNLVAAETLGGVSTICLDKTGTITLGKMTATGVRVSKKGDENLIYESALLCNDYRDPLEYAMADLAMNKLSEGKEQIEEKYKRVDEIAFDPKYKYILTRHKNGTDKYLDILSGAPEVVLAMSDSVDKESWIKSFAKIGRVGNRMVAFSTREVVDNEKNKKLKRENIKGFKFLGIILFDDPVREGVEESLQNARKMGINLKVITGDYKETSWVAMQRAGLVEKGAPVDSELVMTGEELVSGDLERIREKIHKAILFARTSPEQKLMIVEILQEMGEVVGMMGDGVNDAPALKKSDIGITVNEASDVAREAADLILLDDNFQTVISSIEEGRVIIDNIKKVTIFLLSGSFSMVVLIVGVLLLGWPLPLIPVQILWVNLVAEVLPSLGLTVEPKTIGIVLRRFRQKEELINLSTFLFLSLISISVGLLGLFVFGYQLWMRGYGLVHAQTLLFAWLCLVPLTYVHSIRNIGTGWRKNSFFDNPTLLFACILSGGLFVAFFGANSLRLLDWWILVGAGVLMFLIIELGKLWLNKERYVD